MQLITSGTLPVLLFLGVVSLAWWRTLLKILATVLVVALVLGVAEIVRALGIWA